VQKSSVGKKANLRDKQDVRFFYCHAEVKVVNTEVIMTVTELTANADASW
jgi:hypothetical protein